MNTALAEKPATELPRFYYEPTLLRFEDHAAAVLAPHDGFGFAKEAVAIPLGISEFSLASQHYPIVFSSADGSPLAVVGLKQGENLFVDQSGAWLPGAYVPAYVRRYPFIVTETPDQSAQLLVVDAQSDRFRASASDTTEGERIFDDEGLPTASARSAMEFCNAFHQEHLRTLEFVAAINGATLHSPKSAGMNFADGSRYVLDGFSAIDDASYRALPLETVVDWHAKRWLDCVAFHQSSMQNWGKLVDLDAVRKQEA